MKRIYLLAIAAACLALPVRADPPAPAPTRIGRLILGGDADASGHKIENLDIEGTGITPAAIGAAADDHDHAGVYLEPGDNADQALTFSRIAIDHDRIVLSNAPGGHSGANGEYNRTSGDALPKHQSRWDHIDGGQPYYITVYDEGADETIVYLEDGDDLDAIVAVWATSDGFPGWNDIQYWFSAVRIASPYTIEISSALSADGLTVTGAPSVTYGSKGITGDVEITGIVTETGAREPMFVVHNTPADQPWTDFYFKGIRDGSVVFSYNTADPTSEGAHLSVWYMDSQHATNPAWLEQATSGSIFSQLVNMNSFVGGWAFVVRGLELSRAEIDGVQWAIAFTDATAAEQDPADGWIWRPLRPVEMVTPGWEPQ